MTIASEITRIQGNISDAYLSCSNKGATIPAQANSDNLANCISSIPTGSTINNEDITVTTNGTYTASSGYTGLGTVEVTVPTVNNTTLSVTPTTSSQSFTPSSPYTGYGTVSVNALTSAIDSDIKASNIKSGVSILGVSGSVVELAGETKNVSITSTSGNTFTPSSGKNGITSITVTPTNQAKTVTATTSSQTITVPSGYSGYGTITVNAVTSSIDANIQAGNIKNGVSILGVTGTYSGGGGSFTGIPLEVSNGVLGYTTTPFEFNMPNATSITRPVGGLNSEFRGCTTITKFSMPDLVAITIQAGAIAYVCYQCTNLTTVDLSSLTTVSYSPGLTYSFYGCTSLTSVDISSLKTVYGTYVMQSFCDGCTSLTSIDLSSMESISGAAAFQNAFANTGLTEVRFTNLEEINAAPLLWGNPTTMENAFKNCPLQNLYFNSLTTVTSSDCLKNMLAGVTGCTVHFPSALQATIGSWASVTNGFGGTNTTVLFDL